MNRAEILDTAKTYVTADRNATHGEAENSLGGIARLWSAYLEREIKPHEVAAMMALLKIARIKLNPHHLDSWTDIAGYAACGGELAGGLTQG